MAPIRVVIAEDNRDLVTALCALLQAEADITVVGTIERTRDLDAVVRGGAAQVVLLDLNLSGESSLPAMRALQRDLPDVAFVIYSGYDRDHVADALTGAGAVEFVSKSGEIEELLQAVRRAGGREVADAGR